LEVELDDITTSVERRPLERTIEVDGMGTFEEGTLGGFRFEVVGVPLVSLVWLLRNRPRP
ncbi:MAG: hypothetical protein J0H19_07410, partial [Rhodospirillales bacterium]|nr:hypothetical protein [Rhodospirillales bacterium]